jgi:hypothetical protein
MVRPDGFEPPTTAFEAQCSIQLSYGRNRAKFTWSATALHAVRSQGFIYSLSWRRRGILKVSQKPTRRDRHQPVTRGQP